MCAVNSHSFRTMCGRREWTSSCWVLADSSDPAGFINSGLVPSKYSLTAHRPARICCFGMESKLIKPAKHEGCRPVSSLGLRSWSSGPVLQITVCTDQLGTIRAHYINSSFSPDKLSMLFCVFLFWSSLGIFFSFLNITALKVLGKFISLVSPGLSCCFLCLLSRSHLRASTESELMILNWL